MTVLFKKTLSVIIFYYFISLSVNSQNFQFKHGEKEKSFKEIQLEFNQWKNSVDISQEHYWKYFKRLENDMQMHTDANG